ncbi:hypothetical protein CFOL_v3_31766 [Cephalotus follicularis]|uniref:Uncharacterized protein n=1 Tax=Cephalotus follicularis TaxID=3775 RepID=A0A1Q3D7P7_CEPFO|nr:hypothetical protein CFOL_v3_31766 [Cephalotus follicularis]
MEERKTDARIYIVTCLFFACIIAGGVLLGLYLIMPSTQSSNRYPIAGMILVGIPWAFWFFAYLYRCFKPSGPQIQQANFNNNHAASSKAAPTTTLMYHEELGGSPVHSPNGGPHVQFGVVTVMGSDKDIGSGAQIHREAMARQAGILLDEDEEGEDKGESSQNNTASNGVSVTSRESEIPLTFG